MPIEHNIEYLRSQLRMFEDILAREEEAMRSLDLAVTSYDRKLTELYAQTRTVRADLMSPSSSPSAAAIEERVRAETRIHEIENLQISFDEAMDDISMLSEQYINLLGELSTIPKDKMSEADIRKINELTALVREQAREFNFSTFDPSEVTISDDTYRPQKEGFEIGFETSASDAIRLKWAYQLSLLEIDNVEKTNHPGMLVFDEPRQQSSAKVSFENLLKRAARAKKNNQQVIFSTSEDLQNLKRITKNLDCEERIFYGYVLQPIE
jgi:hypothetical protein